MNSLAVSEHFYSIQGEGAYVGVPSIFLRLKGCNLTCGGVNTVKSKQLDSAATWRCDTIEVWLQGDRLTFDEIFEIFEENNYISLLKKGAHLIVTGGEPLLQHNELASFFSAFNTKYAFKPFVEIETNGTVAVKDNLACYINQYNVSIKLANSGMLLEKRVYPEVIASFVEKKRCSFKFVVNSKEDVDEVFASVVSVFNIAYENVYLMPGASSREQLLELEPVIIELCKAYCVNYSTRLHIHVWNQLTGV